MPHVEADSASIYSHRSQSHPHPHLHRSHGSNGHHHHHHHHHRKRSKNGPAAIGGSLDVHVRVHSAEAFWQELEAVVELPEGATLTQLDNTLRMFISFCAVYHGKSARSRGLVICSAS
ncbi:hypothetical protein JCM24511_06787 [Saitozyma sp. JCM 24511]|nr:hypothetical protein JCM24511_06787 [Saitozyma sp. JCM 24511]